MFDSYDLIVLRPSLVVVGSVTILTGLVMPTGERLIRKDHERFARRFKNLVMLSGQPLEIAQAAGQVVITGFVCEESPGLTAGKFAEYAYRCLEFRTCIMPAEAFRKPLARAS